MVYESTFNELGFNNGTYGIYVTDATQNPWGMTFDNLRFNSGLTVGAMRMSALNAVPNNRYGRIFCDCKNMIGPVFNLKGYNFVIDTIEFIAANQGAKLMLFQAGAKFEIGTLNLKMVFILLLQIFLNLVLVLIFILVLLRLVEI